MDRRAEACGASFLPSLPSFQFLSSAFRTDSLVLAICAPFTGLIYGETRLRRKGQRGNPKSWSSLPAMSASILKGCDFCGLVGNRGCRFQTVETFDPIDDH